MSIAFDAATQAAVVFSNTNTMNHAIGAAGQHRIANLLAMLGDSSRAITAITFGGLVPTFYGSIATLGAITGKLYAYYMLAPVTGVNAFAITLSGVSSIALAVVSYTGVDQTAPFLNPALTTTCNDPCVPSIAVPSQIGNLVVDWLGLESGGAGAGAVVGAGQTQRNYVGAAVGGGSAGDGMSDEPGAATTTMSWTSTGGGLALIAGSMRPFVSPRVRAIRYFFNIWDPTMAVRDGQGARLEPNEITADEWIQADGYTLGEPQAYSDFIRDPSKSRIVSKTYRKGSVNIKTSKNQFGQAIVARAAAGRI